MKSKSLRTMDNVKRGECFSVDPRTIKINWSDNPRIDYGQEEFQELKRQIKNDGVETPINLYLDKDNNLCLAQGFRRMKAVLELIEEGVNIELVPFKKVENNMEAILATHITANSGKDFNDIEYSNTVVKLFNYANGDYNKVKDRIGHDYQKVYRYVNFGLKASTLIKEKVLAKVISFGLAYDIVESCDGVEEQNEMLNGAIETSKENGNEGKKIKPSEVKGLKKKTETKKATAKVSFKDITTYLIYLRQEQIESVNINTLMTVIERIEKGDTVDDIINDYENVIDTAE